MNAQTRATGIALALIALLAAPACGRYGEPSRSRPDARAVRAPTAAAAPTLAPADGSGEECPPEAQQSDEEKRTP